MTKSPQIVPQITPRITFVCCVESGWLEAQTIRLVQSLRRWGGQFADAPVIAITPRFGPPLTQKTHRVLRQHDVEYLNFAPESQYSWFPFLNKPQALAMAEERSTTEYVAWLDSDLLFLDEPSQLIPVEKDFLACASYKTAGTSGPGDPFDPYWREICQTVGLDIDALPWITTQVDGKRLRLYWNGGIFVYRRQTGFGKHYLDTCIQLLNARSIAQAKGFALVVHEQSAVGLAVVKMGISWGDLPSSHDYAMSSLLREWYKEADLKAAKILHYHHFMWPNFWPEFIQRMHITHPKVADWLESIGPLKNEAAFYCRSMSKVLKYYRGKQESTYEKSCRAV